MIIIGISNKLDEKHSLFFYEFDKINGKKVLEEADYLATKFNIDIFVLESSENSYHLISFDILTNEKVLTICRNVRIESDYIDMDIQKLYGNGYEDNCLRISYKGLQKCSPKFLMFYYDDLYMNGLKQIAINHYNLYRKIADIPDYYLNLSKMCYVPYEIIFVKYHTGIEAKRWNFNK